MPLKMTTLPHSPQSKDYNLYPRGIACGKRAHKIKKGLIGLETGSSDALFNSQKWLEGNQLPLTRPSFPPNTTD